MRTLAEVNRDLQKVNKELEELEPQYRKISRRYRELRIKRIALNEEKEEIWDALYEGHRNIRI